MMFHVGQKVVCVDDSLPANPWHRQYPLVLKKIYVVQHCFQKCVDIDGSRRGWQNWRFRPVVEKKTDISIFTEMLTPSRPRVLEKNLRPVPRERVSRSRLVIEG